MTPPSLADQRLNRPPFASSVRGSNHRLPKADADVADLLGVNALADHAAPPAPLSSAPDDAADVLNDLVEDHLQRATDASPNPVAAGGSEEQRVDLLRAEIDALLADPVPTPAGAAHRHEDDLEILPMQSGAVTDDELAMLLPPTGKQLDGAALNAAETFQGAADVAAELDSEVTAIQAADEELARELANLKEDQQAAIRPDTRARAAGDDIARTETLEALAIPERDAAPVLEAHPLPDAPIEPATSSASAPPIPVVILQPDEEEESAAAPRRGIVPRIKAAVSEAALMLAQLLDLPFSWLNGLDKHLLGIAAIVFFLSGCILMLFGWYMGAR